MSDNPDFGYVTRFIYKSTEIIIIKNIFEIKKVDKTFIKAIKTDILMEGTNLIDFISKNLKDEIIKDGDIIVISSKIVSLSEGRLVNLKNVQVSEVGKALAVEFCIDEKFAQLIINERSLILGGVKKVVATINKNIVIPFAGADLSNTPPGYAILWPKNPSRTAFEIRNFFSESRNVKTGIIISDSQIVPLRTGTYGIALGIAGFIGVVDKRGSIDIFGKEMKVTRWNLADNLASAANLIMGEGEERKPIAIIRDAPITLTDEDPSKLTQALSMDEEECLLAQFLLNNS